MNSGEKKPSILIVDDMPTNISVLCDLLQYDYQIKAATGGKDAIKIAQGVDKPDLILLDVEMPEIDGYTVCKELKNNLTTNKIPIIFITARNTPEDEEYGFNLGAVDYISKPFYPSIVKMRVKTHIDMKLKSDMLEELSMMDGLTHIANRRFFDDSYAQAFKESKRDDKNLFLLMIDVDYFKNYNDHYGHGKGDDCLIRIASTLKNSLKRPSDLVARYGGEEFIVLLKNIDDEGAKCVAANLVAAVENLGITHSFSCAAKSVTISLGMASKEEGMSQEELLKKADDALYKAKEKGRNQFVCDL
jgi:diguanylate cyclase (GGDEF)-like protein